MPNSGAETSGKRGSLLFAVLAAAFAAVVVTYPVLNLDIFWHMANGREMLGQGRIINEEIFSFTAAGREFHNNEWLSQILLYLSFKTLSYNGLLALKAALAASIGLLLYGAARLCGAGPLASFVIATCAVFVGVERYKVRPHLFTLLFIALQQYLLFGFARGKVRWRWLLALPAIYAVWDFTHHSHFGFLYLGAFMVAEAAGYFLGKEKRPADRDVLKKLGIVFALALAVFALNPYGLASSGIFAKVVSGQDVMFAIGEEFQPTTLAHHGQFWALMAAAFALALIFSRRIGIAPLIVMIPFAVLAARFTRETATFALVAVPALAGGISLLAPKIREALGARVFRIAAYGVLVATLIYPAYFKFYAEGNPMAFGTGVHEEFYPMNAADFVEASGISGNMFNEEYFGGYLAYRFYPQRRIFMYNLGGVFDDVAQSMHSAAFVDEYSINYGVVGRMWMLGTVFPEDRWARLYWDDTATVVLRRTPENRAIIDRYELRALAPGTSPAQADRLAADPAGRRRVIRELAQLLAFDRNPRKASYLAALLLMPDSQYDPAETTALVEKALKKNDGSPELANALGQLYYRMGQRDEAAANLRRAIALDPSAPLALITLGFVEYDSGRYPQAEELFVRTLKADPENANAYYGLGLVYEKMGQKEKAIGAWEAYLKRVPSGGWADRAQRHLRSLKGGG